MTSVCVEESSRRGAEAHSDWPHCMVRHILGSSRNTLPGTSLPKSSFRPLQPYSLSALTAQPARCDLWPRSTPFVSAMRTDLVAGALPVQCSSKQLSSRAQPVSTGLHVRLSVRNLGRNRKWKGIEQRPDSRDPCLPGVISTPCSAREPESFPRASHVGVSSSSVIQADVCFSNFILQQDTQGWVAGEGPGMRAGLKAVAAF